MGINLVQKSDGSAALVSDRGSIDQLRVGGVASGGNSYRGAIVVRVPLNAVDTGGGIFSWQAPASTDILISRVLMDVTAAASATCTVDVGTTATGATTSSDNLIDGLDVNAAAGLFDNITNIGVNGKARQRLAAGKWVNASTASGASAGLAGFAYIHYVPVGV